MKKCHLRLKKLIIDYIPVTGKKFLYDFVALMQGLIGVI